MGKKAFAKFIAVAALLLMGAADVYADVYGSISGIVRDSSGSPLPGVSVTVTGPVLPKGRDAVTDSSGNYSFLNLPPGTYDVTASLSGLGSVRGGAIVAVDKDTSLHLQLSPTITEAITVMAAIPAVDMKSTEVNFNYDAKTIERLPLPRTYQGLFQLAPGIAETNTFAPVAGGGRQENKYLLDGVSVTNPLFGYVGIGNTDTNELDIQDFNVKRAAFSAEFGRATGMVVNAVTKSGTNELAGAIRQEWQPGNWASEAKDLNFNANTDRSRTAANIGGPIWRDHVFGYASGRYELLESSGRTNFFGPVPDRKTTIKEGFGKLTATPTSSQFIAIGYRHIPLDEPLSGVGTFDLPEVAFDFENTNKVETLDYNWNATKSTMIEAKVLRMSEKNHFVAQTDLGFKPPFDPRNLRQMGAVRIPDPGGSGVQVNGGAYYVRLSTQDYRQREAKLSVAQFFDFGGTSHQFKAGVGYEYGDENLQRLSNGWGIITDIGSGQLRADYYPDQPPQLSFGRTYSVYVQDSVTVTPRLNLNVGVVAHKDEFGEDLGDEEGRRLTFLKFDFGEQIQPRIGVNYNIRENVGDKVYANYARYSNMDQKSSARGLAPFGLMLFSATFDATTGALISERRRTGQTFNAIILPGTKPMYTDEFLVGYAAPMGSLWTFDAFGMFRDTKRFIEDYPDPAPNGDFYATNIDAAKRRYYGVTVDVGRRFASRWSTNVNYTWSRLYGNYDIDYSGGALYNAASALHDTPGAMIDDPNRWGPALHNHTHVLKAFASFEVIPNLSLGGFYRYQSGAPWNALGRDYSASFRRYIEPAGSRHLPGWSNVDFSASYGLPLARDIRVTLEARVLNALDQQTVLSVDRIQYLDAPNYLSEAPWLGPQGTSQPNPTFGQPLSYAAPRRYIATLRVNF